MPSIAETVVAEMSGEAQPIAPEVTAEEAPGEEADQTVEVEESGDEGTKTSKLSWAQAMDRVPPDIAKLMKQMQADYTRKTQDVAEQRREFKREREALLRGTANLKAPDELPDYDPFNEQSIAARIEAEVAKRLREVLDPMEQEYHSMKAEDSYKSFLSEHPDLETDEGLRSDIQVMLEGNESLDLETAYFAAKGRRKTAQKAAEEQTRAARKKAQREAAFKGTGISRRPGRAAKPQKNDLKKMSAADIYRLAQEMSRNS